MKVDTDLLISGIDYTWSGYCENKEEFINSNFLKAIENGHSVMLCSEDNMPGLCDYLFNFVTISFLLFNQLVIDGIVHHFQQANTVNFFLSKFAPQTLD